MGFRFNLRRFAVKWQGRTSITDGSGPTTVVDKGFMGFQGRCMVVFCGFPLL
jgi:hypothetical protein